MAVPSTPENAPLATLSATGSCGRGSKRRVETSDGRVGVPRDCNKRQRGEMRARGPTPVTANSHPRGARGRRGPGRMPWELFWAVLFARSSAKGSARTPTSSASRRAFPCQMAAGIGSAWPPRRHCDPVVGCRWPSRSRGRAATGIVVSGVKFWHRGAAQAPDASVRESHSAGSARCWERQPRRNGTPGAVWARLYAIPRPPACRGARGARPARCFRFRVAPRRRQQHS